VHTREHIESVLSERYQLGLVLRRDSLTVRYDARDREGGRAVALEILWYTAQSLGFTLERVLALLAPVTELRHSNLRTVETWSESHGVVFGVMAHLPGESLAYVLARERVLAIDRALQIVTDLVAALDYVHGCGVVRWDIDPLHTFLQDDRALLDDNRVLSALQSAPEYDEESWRICGAPSYMPPEILGGLEPYDRRSDQYALASIFVEMLTGKTPHEWWSPVHPSTERSRSQRPALPQEVRRLLPKHVDRAVARALATKPKDRFPNSQKFVEALVRSTKQRDVWPD